MLKYIKFILPATVTLGIGFTKVSRGFCIGQDGLVADWRTNFLRNFNTAQEVHPVTLL